MLGSIYKEATKTVSWRRPPGNWAEPMNVKHWMRKWHHSFADLGVDLIVADVAQSCVVVDVVAKRIILAPSLKLTAADKILQRVYQWWRDQSHKANAQLCSFLSC